MQNGYKDNVRSSAVGKQLKQKKSNSLSSPAPPPCSWALLGWLLRESSAHLLPLDLAWTLNNTGTLFLPAPPPIGTTSVTTMWRPPHLRTSSYGSPPTAPSDLHVHTPLPLHLYLVRSGDVSPQEWHKLSEVKWKIWHAISPVFSQDYLYLASWIHKQMFSCRMLLKGQVNKWEHLTEVSHGETIHFFLSVCKNTWPYPFTQGQKPHLKTPN